VRTPRPAVELQDVWPEVYAQLMEIRQTLESELRDMQDFEFTIEKDRLFMLQTRNGKRTGLAAIRIAVDLCDQGLISPDEALMRIEPEQLNQLLRPIFGPDDKARAVAEGRVKAKGLPAGPGAASGRVVFSAADAEAWAARGEQILLVRDFTSPKDIRGMDAAQGILTAQGGMTSHAALVARQMGKVCICGASAVDIHYDAKTVTISGEVFKEGDFLSIDGTSGTVYGGQLKTAPSEIITGIGLGWTYASGGNDEPIEGGPFENNPLTTDPERYARNRMIIQTAPSLGLGSPTIGWLRAALRSIAKISAPDYPLKVKVPLLLFAAGMDSLVSTTAIEEFGQRLKVGTHVLLSQARHEILQETDAVRKDFWAAFDAYMGVDTPVT
jgi:phosphohistidine swiveling domain-containing protein